MLASCRLFTQPSEEWIVSVISVYSPWEKNPCQWHCSHNMSMFSTNGSWTHGRDNIVISGGLVHGRCMKICKNHIIDNFIPTYLAHYRWNCPGVDTSNLESTWIQVIVVSSGNKPLPETKLTSTYVTILRHHVTTSSNITWWRHQMETFSA